MRRGQKIETTLTGKTEFEFLFNNGRLFRGSSINLLHCDYVGSSEVTRIAVCVSRKTGNAVCRNRLKRVTRAVLNNFTGMLKCGSLVAFFPTKEFDKKTFPERIKTVQSLLKKAKLIQQA